MTEFAWCNIHCTLCVECFSSLCLCAAKCECKRLIENRKSANKSMNTTEKSTKYVLAMFINVHWATQFRRLDTSLSFSYCGRSSVFLFTPYFHTMNKKSTCSIFQIKLDFTVKMVRWLTFTDLSVGRCVVSIGMKMFGWGLTWKSFTWLNQSYRQNQIGSWLFAINSAPQSIEFLCFLFWQFVDKKLNVPHIIETQNKAHRTIKSKYSYFSQWDFWFSALTFS